VERTAVGQAVNAGDVIAAGMALGTAIRLKGARRLGLQTADMERELRVPVGGEVSAGTLLARTGRRFPRTLTAPIDGRLLHLTADGDVYVAPIVGRWIVRSTLDGAFTGSGPAARPWRDSGSCTARASPPRVMPAAKTARRSSASSRSAAQRFPPLSSGRSPRWRARAPRSIRHRLGSSSSRLPMPGCSR